MPKRRRSSRFYIGRHEHRRDARIKRNRILWTALSIALIVLLILPFWSASHVVIEHTTLSHADLPKDVGTLRVVYASDFHTGRKYDQKQAQALVRTINNLNPDLLLLGGDYAADPESSIAFFQNAPKFHARYAVCGVLGDHDRANVDLLQPLKQAMYSAGVRPLCNSSEAIRIGSGSVIYIAGLDDANVGQPDVASLAANFQTSDYVILMAHNPAVIVESLETPGMDGKTNWFDLGLFGHTLGGKVPFIGKTIMNLSSLPDRYMNGWTQGNRIDLLTSRGIGTSGLPIRIFRSPQIHVITIKSGQ